MTDFASICPDPKYSYRPYLTTWANIWRRRKKMDITQYISTSHFPNVKCTVKTLRASHPVGIELNWPFRERPLCPVVASQIQLDLSSELDTTACPIRRECDCGDQFWLSLQYVPIFPVAAVHLRAVSRHNRCSKLLPRMTSSLSPVVKFHYVAQPRQHACPIGREWMGHPHPVIFLQCALHLLCSRIPYKD